MRPVGVTNHYSRIFTPNATLTNETFRAGVGVISDNVMDAVKSVMTCSPDYLVMGMSAITFFGGAKGADAFVRRIEEFTGVGISVGSHSASAALRAYGGVKRIAILSPYWPVMNEAVIGYFTDMGFSVVRDIALQCTSWTGIADVTPAQCREALRQLDGDDVDALVQVGTNLSMIRLAAAAELWLGKPVIAINTATYWRALRANGITDRIEGFGRLLAEF
jgi:maleate isomerase